MNAAAWIAIYLAGAFLLAVAVGKAIKRHQADTDRFQRQLRDPNSDNDRDDLGGPQ